MNNNLNTNSEDRFITSGDDVSWSINGVKKSNEEINKEMETTRKKLNNESINKYLIIGSVVGTKNSFDEIMIIGYNYVDSNGTVHDYIGCSYPTGVTKETFCFNHQDITRIYFIGFTTDYGNRYVKNTLLENTSNTKKEI